MTSLPHRITIEETWAQRLVMEPEMNAARMENFTARLDAFRCAVPIKVDSRIAPCITKDTQTDKTIARLHWQKKPSNRPWVIV
jgi:hypothetical protein